MASSSDIIDLADENGPIKGVVLKYTDRVSTDVFEPMSYTLWKSTSKVVNFVRASHPKHVMPVLSVCDTLEDTPGRITFSCPVMSRRHARLTFSESGSVTIMDLKSLHGTYRRHYSSTLPATRLSPNVEYALNDGDRITLGKEVIRDDKTWEPVEIRVEILREKEKTFVDLLDSPGLSPEAERFIQERFTPNRYGLYTPPPPCSAEDEASHESSHGSSSSSDVDADATSHASCGSDSSQTELQDHAESPVGAGKSGCATLLPLGKLPSLRDLGFRDIFRRTNFNASRPAHLESRLSSFFSSQAGEDLSTSPPSSSYPENQLGLLEMQSSFPSSVPLQGGGSPEPEAQLEVDSDEGISDVEKSPRSSPMELSSEAGSRIASPSPVGAWPDHASLPSRNLNISDLSKKVINALRPVIELSSRIGPENGKGKGVDLRERIATPALPHLDDCRSDLFLPPILNSPPTFEFDNVWRTGPESPVVQAGPATTKNAEASECHAVTSSETSLSALSTRMQDFLQSEMVNMKDRIQDLKDSLSPLIERQLNAAKAMPTASEFNAEDVLASRDGLVKADGITDHEVSSPKQELQDIRDEMSRFSTLLEQVLTKVDSSKGTVSHMSADLLSEHLIEDLSVPIIEEVHSPVADFSAMSRKRKRSDEEFDDEDAGFAYVAESSAMISPPAKRRRRGPAIAKSIAKAAGFTTLGAVATWATLAYCV